MLNTLLLLLIEQRKYTTKDRSWWQGVVVGVDSKNLFNSDESWPPETSCDPVVHCPTCGQIMYDESSKWAWVCQRCLTRHERKTITLGHVGTVPLILLKGLRGESAYVITVPLDLPNQKKGPK